MKRDGKLIVALVLLLALQAALTAGLQVYGLEPTWTGYWRIVKSVLASLNWGVGLCAAFYLRARWPSWFAWIVVGLGVVAVGAFYSSWYSAWTEYQRWVGLAYGLLMAAFDASLIGYGLTVVGREQRKVEDDDDREREHQRALELAGAEDGRRQGAMELAQAETGKLREQRLLALAEARVLRVQGVANKQLPSQISPVALPLQRRVTFEEFAALPGNASLPAKEVVMQYGIPLRTVYNWLARLRAEGGRK